MEGRNLEADRRVRVAEDRARWAEDRSREAEDRAREAEDRARKTEDRAREAEDRAEDRARGAEDRARELERNLTEQVIHVAIPIAPKMGYQNYREAIQCMVGVTATAATGMTIPQLGDERLFVLTRIHVEI